MVQTCSLAVLDVITRHHRQFGTQGTVVSTPDNYNSSPQTAEARAIFPPSPTTIRRRASMCSATSAPNVFSSDAAARVRSRLRARGRRPSLPPTSSNRGGAFDPFDALGKRANGVGVGATNAWVSDDADDTTTTKALSLGNHPHSPPPRAVARGRETITPFLDGAGTQRAARLPTMRKPSTSSKSPQTRTSPNPNQRDQRTWSDDGTRLVAPTQRGTNQTSQTSQTGLPMPPTTGTRTCARTRGRVGTKRTEAVDPFALRTETVDPFLRPEPADPFALRTRLQKVRAMHMTRTGTHKSASSTHPLASVSVYPLN